MSLKNTNANLNKRSHLYKYFWFKYNLGQKYHAPQVRPDWGSDSSPPDHDGAFHVTETPALTTQPSVTSVLVSKVWIGSSETPTFCFKSSIDTAINKHNPS